MQWFFISGYAAFFMRFLFKFKALISRNVDLLLFVLSVALFFFLLASPQVHAFISSSKDWGYFGALIAGLFFSYGLTSLPAVAVLAILSESLNVVVMAFIAAAGATASDFFLFTVMRKKIVERVRIVERSNWFAKLKETKRFKFLTFLLPIAGGLLIASPVPDEIAIAVLGFSKLNSRIFLLLAFCAKFFGILVIAGIASLF